LRKQRQPHNAIEHPQLPVSTRGRNLRPPLDARLDQGRRARAGLAVPLGCVASHGLHVKLIDRWRQYRGEPLDLLELNRLVINRVDAGLRRAGNNGNRIEDGSGSTRPRLYRRRDRRVDRNRTGRPGR
jgi:hypothetical protein